MFKNALVSVSDKRGLVEFLKPLVARGLRVVSTGGTAQHLKENGIAITDISEQTQFPEVMGGRVKTLHPFVHMPLLARQSVSEDFALLKEHQLEPFDLLIVNLYPFEEALLQKKSFAEMIEKIDIGGPTLLRAAAKNFERLTVICDPNDYEGLARNGTSMQVRKDLAAKVFRHVSSYDAMIANFLSPHSDNFFENFVFAGKKVQSLRYGENPQQQAAWFSVPGQLEGWQSAKILQGKELSYNNLLDLEAARNLVIQFESAAAVAVKHNNPCGVGLDENITVAVERALGADPVSVFGGIVAINRPLNAKVAELLASLFLECVIAPDYQPEALQILSKKKNLRLLQWPNMAHKLSGFDFRSVAGGFLVQQPDSVSSDPTKWKFLGEKPSENVSLDLIFAEKIVSALKSNAIAIVQGGQTLGLGMGQVNRVDAVEHAIERMQKHHPANEAAVLASDAFFPFPDSIEKISKAGIRWVLQPGGSARDEEVFSKARELGVNLVISGVRHFRH